MLQGLTGLRWYRGYDAIDEAVYFGTRPGGLTKRVPRYLQTTECQTFTKELIAGNNISGERWINGEYSTGAISVNRLA